MKIDDSQVIEVENKKIGRKKTVKKDEGVNNTKKTNVKKAKVTVDGNQKIDEEKKGKVKKVVKKSEEIKDKVLDYDNNIEKIKSIDPNDNRFKYIMIFLLGFVLAFAGFYCFNDYIVSKDGASMVINENGITKGINKIYDAVVYIENYKGNDLSSSGTGFIYKKENGKAYILTNNHVVSDSTSLKITLADGKKVNAKFLGGDEYLDIACLVIDDKYVTTVAKFGSSNSLELGATLFTVGSPVGDEYRGTVTRGILSGKDRMVSVSIEGGNNDYIMKVLQTDAAMNPGNSGGPLCNANGEVIGINSLKLVKNEVEGMGFAIAVEDIKGHLSTFEQGKSIQRPYLGIAILDLENTDALKYYDLEAIVDTKLEKGVVIESVEEGSVSYGKLQRGDIVTKVNGVKVDSIAYFRYELYKYEAGDKITISVERNGKYKDIVIVLQTKKDN